MNACDVHATLSRMQEIGILAQDIVIENSVLVHEKNDQSFVSMRGLSQQFVHARAILPDNSGNYRYATRYIIDQLKSREKIDIISGPCLFSGSSIKAIGASGNVYYLGYPPVASAINEEIIAINTNLAIQPYEAEAVIRLTQTIGMINPEKNTVVYLNVPRMEYYFYGLELFRKGLLSQEVLKKWFTAVNERAERIEYLLARRLQIYQQKDRIKKVSPLEEIEDVVRLGVADNSDELFETIVQKLQSNKLWRQLLKRGKPKTFIDLSNLSYVAAELTLAQDRESTVVAIENPEEFAILRETIKYLPGILKGANILGIFPHPQLVLKSDSQSIAEGRYMYFYNGGGLGPLKEIIKATR